jgi:ParB family chromosome partitioning protein
MLQAYTENKNRPLFGIVQNLDINKIKLPLFRLHIVEDEDIQNMANSIKQNGLLQPIVARAKEGEEFFEIVAGCTRFLAVKSLKWRKVPCHVIYLDDKQAFEVTLTENIQRKSINSLDEARAFKKYCFDNGWGSVSDLAFKIGKSSSYITKRISLLELPIDVQESIRNGSLKLSTAEEILTVKNPNMQSQLAQLIKKKHLTTMKARQLVKEKDGDKDKAIVEHDLVFCNNHQMFDLKRDIMSLDKAIIALRIAMSQIASFIEEEEEEYGRLEGQIQKDKVLSNIFVKELLMHQKILLHQQIDNIIRAKRKYEKNFYLFQKMLHN